MKKILQDCLFAFIRLLPYRWLVRARRRIGNAARKHTRLHRYFERVATYLNRRYVTEASLKSGAFLSNETHANQLHEYVLNSFVEEPIDYLEFGVWRGGTMSWWLSRLGPDSSLYGFDSFEGLPEDWNFEHRRKQFDCQGEVPQLVAPNLRFIKGWFDATVEPFLATTSLKERLVIHMDADLYSSTIFVFRAMKSVMRPGTIVIFDEYWDLKGEFKALEEFSLESGKTFEYLVISDTRAVVRFAT
jgi:hypothetical protein